MEELDCMDIKQNFSQYAIVSGLWRMLMAAISGQCSHKSKRQSIDVATPEDDEVSIA